MSYRDDLSTVLGYAWAMAENLEADSARELREAVERIRTQCQLDDARSELLHDALELARDDG